MRRMLAHALIVLGVPFGVVLVAAGPASACTAELLTPVQQQRMANVFTGQVTDIAVREQGGARTRVYAVAVEQWWRGELPAQVRVVSPVGKADCGLRGVKEGASYLFLADGAATDGQVRALSFQGTRAASKSAERKMTKLTGAKPRPPVTTPEPAPTQPVATVLDDSEPPPVIEAVTPAAVLVLVGALLFAVGTALGRREH